MSDPRKLVMVTFRRADARGERGVAIPLTRNPLDGGGCILVEQPAAAWEGPVKAGRVADAVRELPVTLQGALGRARR